MRQHHLQNFAYRVSLQYRLTSFLSRNRQSRFETVLHKRDIHSSAQSSSDTTIFTLDSYPSPGHSIFSPSKSSSHEKRLEAFRKTHFKHYKTTLESRQREKREKFHVERRTIRNQQYNANRGLWLCGESQFWARKKINLGNDLHISEGYFKSLDRDKDQSYPDIPIDTQFIRSKATAANPHPLPVIPIQIQTIQGQRGLDSSPLYLQDKFIKAEALVRKTFGARGIDADLSRVVENGFSVDVCIKQTFHIGTPEPGDDAVIGAVMFVFMKKYVWIEEIGVEETCRGMGVGRALIERIKRVAHLRGKDILLYSLMSAVPFYNALGFESVDLWQIDCKAFAGQYLVYKAVKEN